LCAFMRVRQQRRANNAAQGPIMMGGGGPAPAEMQVMGSGAAPAVVYAMAYDPYRVQQPYPFQAQQQQFMPQFTQVQQFPQEQQIEGGPAPRGFRLGDPLNTTSPQPMNMQPNTPVVAPPPQYAASPQNPVSPDNTTSAEPDDPNFGDRGMATGS